MCTFTYGIPLPQLVGPQQAPINWVLILAIPWFIIYYLLFVHTLTPLARRRKAERLFLIAVMLYFAGFIVFDVGLSWFQAIETWENAQFVAHLSGGCYFAAADMAEHGRTVGLIVSAIGMLCGIVGGIFGL